MKKLITSGLIAMSLALSGCSDALNTNGTTYHPYGLLNSEKKSDQVCYDTNVADVVLGVIFIETAVVPIYVFGFNVKEPVKLKDKNGNCPN